MNQTNTTIFTHINNLIIDQQQKIGQFSESLKQKQFLTQLFSNQIEHLIVSKAFRLPGEELRMLQGKVIALQIDLADKLISCAQPLLELADSRSNTIDNEAFRTAQLLLDIAHSILQSPYITKSFNDELQTLIKDLIFFKYSNPKDAFDERLNALAFTLQRWDKLLSKNALAARINSQTFETLFKLADAEENSSKVSLIKSPKTYSRYNQIKAYKGHFQNLLLNSIKKLTAQYIPKIHSKQASQLIHIAGNSLQTESFFSDFRCNLNKSLEELKAKVSNVVDSLSRVPLMPEPAYLECAWKRRCEEEGFDLTLLSMHKNSYEELYKTQRIAQFIQSGHLTLRHMYGSFNISMKQLSSPVFAERAAYLSEANVDHIFFMMNEEGNGPKVTLDMIAQFILRGGSIDIVYMWGRNKPIELKKTDTFIVGCNTGSHNSQVARAFLLNNGCNVPVGPLSGESGMRPDGMMPSFSHLNFAFSSSHVEEEKKAFKQVCGCDKVPQLGAEELASYEFNQPYADAWFKNFFNQLPNKPYHFLCFRFMGPSVLRRLLDRPGDLANFKITYIRWYNEIACPSNQCEGFSTKAYQAFYDKLSRCFIFS